MADPPTGGFAQRLTWLLAGRKLTPWAKHLGMAGASIDAMRGDAARPPSHEFLTRIMRTENASLSWLLGADVPPFLHTITRGDSDTATALAAHLDDEDWRVALLTDGSATAWVLHQPAAIVHPRGEIPYRAITVIAGPSASATERALSESGHAAIEHVQHIPSPSLDSVARGMAGTWALFGNSKTPGLLNNATAKAGITLHNARPDEAWRISEEPPGYADLPPPARAIAGAWDRLPEPDRQALSLVVERLVSDPAPPRKP